jgi:beta-glucosidase
LRRFRRISLEAGASLTLEFELSAKDLSLINEAGERVLEPGRFRLSVGGSQPDPRSEELMGQAPLSAELEVTGETLPLDY